MTQCQVCAGNTDAYLCRDDTIKLERAVGDLASLMHELGTVITRQTRVYRSSTATTRPPASDDPEAAVPAHLRTRDGRIALRPTALPVNLDASELLWVAWNTIVAWAKIVAEHHDVIGPTDATLLPWLTAHVEALRWQDDAGEAYDELTSLRRDLERAVDRSPERLWAGPCGRDGCDRDLYAWPGRDTITCDGYRGDGIGCQAAHTTAERRVWLLAAVRERSWTLRELWDAAPSLLGVQVAWETVRRWPRPVGRSTPRLLPVGTSLAGDPLYRGADVIDLMLDDATRPGRRRAC